MELRQAIQQAQEELTKHSYPWGESALRQLEFCLDVMDGTTKADNLEKLTIGWFGVRELDGDESNPLYDLLPRISYEMQHTYLSDEAKVRLGIHRRA